jgi:hypothetical protein
MTVVDVHAGDWRRMADETNAFSPDDTLEVRLQRFNELTGLGLTVSEPCRHGKVTMVDKDGKPLRTEDRSSWRRFVYPDGRTTGPMDEETMMHWTAQVGFGYRLAKAQG